MADEHALRDRTVNLFVGDDMSPTRNPAHIDLSVAAAGEEAVCPDSAPILVLGHVLQSILDRHTPSLLLDRSQWDTATQLM
jgi:hypothetical protein